MKSKYNKTITACFVGYIVQAIVNNYVAGNLQQGIGDSSEGRHHAVCTSALGGDIGCSGGPTLVGLISSHAGDNLKAGILAAIIFPILLFGGIVLCKKAQR